MLPIPYTRKTAINSDSKTRYAYRIHCTPQHLEPKALSVEAVHARHGATCARHVQSNSKESLFVLCVFGHTLWLWDSGCKDDRHPKSVPHRPKLIYAAVL